MGLVDRGSSSLPYTWHNKQTNIKAIFERLYQALPNLRWIGLYPTQKVINLPIRGPDHSAIILNTCHINTQGQPSLFRRAKWLLEPTYS